MPPAPGSALRFEELLSPDGPRALERRVPGRRAPSDLAPDFRPLLAATTEWIAWALRQSLAAA